MRGGPAVHRRSRSFAQPRNEATARTYSLPAPYGGWNARGNLTTMPSTQAIQMDNIFPGVQNVGLRKGCIDWVTGFALNIKALLPHSGKNVDKLFAATNGGIYNVTASGAVGAIVQASTNGAWESVNFANAGGNWMSLVNGTDAYTLYDGTTWTTPAVTGVSGASLNYLTVHQRRLWFIEKNSMNLWYFATDAISGAATLFPVGSQGY